MDKAWTVDIHMKTGTTWSLQTTEEMARIAVDSLAQTLNDLTVNIEHAVLRIEGVINDSAQRSYIMVFACDHIAAISINPYA